MKSDPINLIYFSPTGTTRRILNGIASGMGAADINIIDLTPRDSDAHPRGNLESGCAIIGVPVYGGRVPTIAVERLCGLRAYNIPAILVTVYGNRAFEDALLELVDISVGRGFAPLACGAFIGEHSFSNSATPIAAGRPDERDMKAAAEFGALAAHKLGVFRFSGETKPPGVPDNLPYKERFQTGGLSPRVNRDRCTVCGICAAVCPSGAISIEDGVRSDPAKCILCHACVKSCPENAMVFDTPFVRGIAEKLAATCSKRKEPEFFL